MNIIERIRCIHRHSVDEHPSCFASGKVIDTRENKAIPWFKEEGMKIGYLDIESDGLKADFGTMLSWCIKEKDGDITYDVITKNELFKGDVDKRLVTSLVNELKKYKIIVTYYGTGFDIPFIRTKALYNKIDFPGYGQLYTFDLYYTVKSKLSLSRKSLEVACDYLGIEGKTPLNRAVWRKAKYGDKTALDEVLEHNRQDVIITEQLHEKLEPFAKWTRKSI